MPAAAWCWTFQTLNFETRLGYVRLAKRPADAQALASFCALYLDRDWLSRLLSTCKTSDAAPA